MQKGEIERKKKAHVNGGGGGYLTGKICEDEASDCKTGRNKSEWGGKNPGKSDSLTEICQKSVYLNLIGGDQSDDN
jgi:hypothetical protein